MHVFITGATGFIGQATIPELLKHGHTVLGLARNETSANLLKSQGVEPLLGDLENHESLKAGARASDAVLHLGFVHDFANMKKCTAIDRAAIEAIVDGFEGKRKLIVIASGTLAMPPGVLATEDTEPKRQYEVMDRGMSEDLVVRLAEEKGFRGVVARFSPTTHGLGDHGFVTMLGNAAKKTGYASYIDDGANRWPAVHRFDAAVFLRLIVEKAQQTSSSYYHAVGEEGVSMKDIMTAVAKKLGIPVESKTVQEATANLGWFAHAISMDNPTSSEKTRKELGWEPTNIGLIADIEANYFL